MQCDFYDLYNYPNGPGDVTIETGIWAVLKRAQQIMMIGANYTLNAYEYSSLPRMRDRWKGTVNPALRGDYRCDSFVVDAFYFGEIKYGGGTLRNGQGTQSPRFTSPWPDPVTTIKMDNLANYGRLPVTIYNRLKEW